jgi:hypothetical protein
MAKWLKNVSGGELTIRGIPLADEAVHEIPPQQYGAYSRDQTLLDAINAEEIKMSYDGVNFIESIESALSCIEIDFFRSSIAVDKDGTDQSLSGEDWTLITADRVLWDFNEDYDTLENTIVIPVDGVYTFDAQIKIKDIVNCSFVEVAMWKVGDPDDYWFILDKRVIVTATEVQLKGTTSFDFYVSDVMYLAVKLYGNGGGTPSATIDGSDDYTAWGYTLSYLL